METEDGKRGSWGGKKTREGWMEEGVNRVVNGGDEKGERADHKVPGEREGGGGSRAGDNILSITNGSNDVIIMDISK